MGTGVGGDEAPRRPGKGSSVASAKSRISSEAGERQADCSRAGRGRKRQAPQQRERDDYVRYANESLVRDLLPILDNFDRALEAARATQEATKVVDGVALIQRELLKVLERVGVTRYSALGERFDPNRHEATGRVVSVQQAPDTVVAEMTAGYLLNGRVLRPARRGRGRSDETPRSFQLGWRTTTTRCLGFRAGGRRTSRSLPPARHAVSSDRNSGDNRRGAFKAVNGASRPSPIRQARELRPLRYGGGSGGSERPVRHHLEDILEISSRAAAAGAGARAPSGRDLQYELKITLEDAASGSTQDPDPPDEACEHCTGNGVSPQQAHHVRMCQGASRSPPRRASSPSRGPAQVPGEGERIETPCKVCRGEGRQRADRMLQVKIPRASRTGCRCA